MTIILDLWPAKLEEVHLLMAWENTLNSICSEKWPSQWKVHDESGNLPWWNILQKMSMSHTYSSILIGYRKIYVSCLTI